MNPSNFKQHKFKSSFKGLTCLFKTGKFCFNEKSSYAFFLLLFNQTSTQKYSANLLTIIFMYKTGH